MPTINDHCRTIFKDAAGTSLVDFTVPELADFESMADKIAAIIKAAQKREQDRITAS
jgi:hypothetical protein